MLSVGCSISSAQIEPNAGKWKTWVLNSGDQLRLPPPPDEERTRTEIEQLKDLAEKRDAATLERIIWWNAGPPGYRWTSIAIPPGPANASSTPGSWPYCRWQSMTRRSQLGTPSMFITGCVQPLRSIADASSTQSAEPVLPE
jgi:hypothetical protein